MQSRTAAQDATYTAVRTGVTLVKGVRVEQHTTDAPKLYLQLFDAVAPTVGTTAPNDVIEIPAGSDNLDMARIAAQFQSSRGGKYYGTGLAYAVTTTHDGLTAPDAGDEPVVTVDYEAVGA